MHNVKYDRKHKDQLVIMVRYFIVRGLASSNVPVKKYVIKHINMKLLNNTKIKLL
jgi:hypothetical protein